MFGSSALTRRGHRGAGAERQVAAYLIASANAAREAGDWVRAALLFGEALQLKPDRTNILIQHAHMLKESGAMEAAERAYQEALSRTPDDSDLALQLGHFYKLFGKPEEARQFYQRALALKPGWESAHNELTQLESTEDLALESMIPLSPEAALRQGAADLTDSAIIARLVPALAPRSPLIPETFGEGLHVSRMGRHEPGFWGRMRTVRGVEAIRGWCISTAPVEEVQLLLDGRVFYRGSPRGPYRLTRQPQNAPQRKYVFNIWHDFSGFALGRHAFELRITDIEGESRSFHDDIVIAPALQLVDFEESDALIGRSNPNPASLERAIRSAPSIVRPAERSVLRKAPKAILVLRTDQLGDLIASIAALRRLRALFPQARIVGLLTAANADLAATLDLFDEIIVIDFADDPVEQRRIMPLIEQEKLRRRLEPYRFDIAIDLAQSAVSRELLLLSGAPFLYGDEEGGFDWLTASFGIRTRDRLNQLDFVPHSRKALALIETLGAIVQDSFEVVRRPDLSRDRLIPFGIALEDRYAVLHMGARISFSRWPGFIDLAARLLAETDLRIVLMTDEPGTRTALPLALVESDRLRLIDERLAFDDFDAFISWADFVVGNDSGPKHLASLRGTPVVTIHTARINWNDWGQERVGNIISRRVPCAGCNIFHNTEECGKDFACVRDIRPAEVFDAIRAYL